MAFAARVAVGSSRHAFGRAGLGGSFPKLQLNVLATRRPLSTKVSMALIKELREQTGAPMIDVKKALVASDCDMEEAAAWLRKKGIATAKKKAGRETTEGLATIAMQPDGRRAAIIELSCETDFVARTEQFQALAQSVADAALANPAIDVAGLLGMPTIGDEIALACGTLGENIQLREVAHIGSDTGVVACYVHAALVPGAGRIACAVDIGTPGDGQVEIDGAWEELGQQLAMQVAAASPAYLDEAAIPSGLLEKERVLAIEDAAATGKPADICEKIATGVLRKWVAENTLVGQEWLMAEPGRDGAAGAKKKKKAVQAAVNMWMEGVQKVSIKDFVRVEIGMAIGGREPTPRPPPTEQA